jgi:hypothetical protein
MSNKNVVETLGYEHPRHGSHILPQTSNSSEGDRFFPVTFVRSLTFLCSGQVTQRPLETRPRPPLSLRERARVRGWLGDRPHASHDAEGLMWSEALSWDSLSHLADALGVITAVPSGDIRLLCLASTTLSAAPASARRRDLRPSSSTSRLLGRDTHSTGGGSVLCGFWAAAQIGGAASIRWSYPEGPAGGLARVTVLKKLVAR